MRPGELVKVKRKDIRFYKREGVPTHKSLCALVQVNPPRQEREVNAMGGVFARRVWRSQSQEGGLPLLPFGWTPVLHEGLLEGVQRMTTFTVRMSDGASTSNALFVEAPNYIPLASETDIKRGAL